MLANNARLSTTRNARVVKEFSSSLFVYLFFRVGGLTAVVGNSFETSVREFVNSDGMREKTRNTLGRPTSVFHRGMRFRREISGPERLQVAIPSPCSTTVPERFAVFEMQWRPNEMKTEKYNIRYTMKPIDLTTGKTFVCQCFYIQYYRLANDRYWPSRCR